MAAISAEKHGAASAWHQTAASAAAGIKAGSGNISGMASCWQHHNQA